MRSSAPSSRGWAGRRSGLKANGGPADHFFVISAHGDRGDIVLGWLTKVVVVLGVLGLLSFDGVSLVQARFQASDRAATAASEAADNYKSTKDPQQAYDAAMATVSGKDTIETKSFTIADDGTVTLRLHHEATTLFIRRIRALHSWTDAVGTGEGRPAL